MGQPILNRNNEMRATMSGSTVTTKHISELDENEQKRYTEKLSVDVEKLPPVLTREKYLQHKEDGDSDRIIAWIYGLKSMTKWKKQHDLKGYSLRPNEAQRPYIPGK